MHFSDLAHRVLRGQGDRIGGPEIIPKLGIKPFGLILARPGVGSATIAEHGCFTPDEITTLPLAASARKTLTEVLATVR